MEMLGVFAKSRMGRGLKMREIRKCQMAFEFRPGDKEQQKKFETMKNILDS